MGGLVICPLDVSASNLRILDSGTADGRFLEQIRWILADPDSATFIGSDITRFEDEVGLPNHVEWHKQDVNAEWPTAWQGTFDFVHQRFVITYTGGFDGALKATTRLARLVRPGGWIQLVDACLPATAISESDPPSQKFFKVLVHFLAKLGSDNTPASRLQDLLRETSELENVQGREAFAGVGIRAANESLRQAGKLWMRGMRETIGIGLAKMGENAPINQTEWNALLDEVENEAETTGFDLPFSAAWGQRKASK